MKTPERKIPESLLPAIWIAGLGGMHVAVILGYPVIILFVLSATAFVTGIARLYRQRGRTIAAGLIALAALCAAAGYLVLTGAAAVARIIVIPGILTPTLIAIGFTRSLLPGREPLIARFARLERGKLDAEIADYSRRLTIAWAVLCWAMSLETLVLGIFAGLPLWSWFANVLNPAIFVGFFLSQYFYAAIRFGRHPSGAMPRTLSRMLRIRNWT